MTQPGQHHGRRDSPCRTLADRPRYQARRTFLFMADSAPRRLQPESDIDDQASSVPRRLII
jgi:hypothetical protein